MQAISYSKPGLAKDVLTLVKITLPVPAQGEVLVRLKTSGVNPSDVKLRAGKRAGAAVLPFPHIIPHSDGAGIIEAVGQDVDKHRIGERVWIWNGQWQRAFGTAAEYIAIPSEQAIGLPDAVSFESGATLGIPALTACHSVLGSGDIAGKTVLIHGGAGTVGGLAVQIAKAAGARVLATASAGEGLTTARQAGADAVFDYRADDLTEQILSYTGGQLIERIIDVEFGANIMGNAELIAQRGTLVSYGSAKVQEPAFPFYPLMFKAVTIELVLVYLLNQEQRHRAVTHLHHLLYQGLLTPPVAARFTLEECWKAHDLVESGAHRGSVILTI